MNFLSYIVVDISLTKNVEGKNTRKNKQENVGSPSHYVTSVVQFTYKILTFYLEQLLKICYEKLQY